MFGLYMHRVDDKRAEEKEEGESLGNERDSKKRSRFCFFFVHVAVCVCVLRARGCVVHPPPHPSAPPLPSFFSFLFAFPLLFFGFPLPTVPLLNWPGSMEYAQTLFFLVRLPRFVSVSILVSRTLAPNAILIAPLARRHRGNSHRAYSPCARAFHSLASVSFPFPLFLCAAAESKTKGTCFMQGASEPKRASADEIHFTPYFHPSFSPLSRSPIMC